MKRLTREQAAILTASTGVVLGPFEDLHAYAEKKLGHPIFTHEFGSESMAEKLKAAAREDLLSICAEEQEEQGP